MVNTNSGYLLNNRYRLIDLIGEGGMANVYLGMDTLLNRRVAVKVLRGDLSHDETFVKRFQREALATTALEHPNLVQVFDVGFEQGYYYIVMEYIEGKTLKQLIKQHGPLSVGETIDVMEQLVSAVEHAHSRGVIHRDIKPQNVIVRSDGTVKLTDFGIAIAQNATQLTQTNSLMGSVHYLAPELAKGQNASEQSDIYSLGILMFELLVGKVPFSSDSAVNIALMHMEDKIPSVHDIVGDDVNQAIENIITKATAKNRAYRYQTAHEMLLDLVDCQYRNDEAALEFDDELEETSVDPLASTIVMDKNNINNNNNNSKKKKNKLLIIIPSIIAGLILIGLVLYFFVFAKSNVDVTMPKLAGMTKDEAVTELKQDNIIDEDCTEADNVYACKNFTIKFSDEESTDVDSGKIISTNPVDGTKLNKGDTIEVSISKGKKVKIPVVVGTSAKTAQSTLENLGFKVNVTYTETDDSTQVGNVISVNPIEGTEVEYGSSVKLEIGSVKKISVPNVMNLTYKTAYENLDSKGLIVSTSNCGEGDTVISQTLAPGTDAQSGDKIELKCEVTTEKNDDETTTPNQTNPDASGTTSE
ncbi:MAG: Stk1 family PASTA domain-containing Ser/Thr kinase [Bacilli bacterium]|jgi:serine/threonine-protein kinase|nr:Stk1 family PASTA domain-containing Ser/Thr kinase [Bacilli bacterium]